MSEINVNLKEAHDIKFRIDFIVQSLNDNLKQAAEYGISTQIKLSDSDCGTFNAIKSRLYLEL